MRTFTTSVLLAFLCLCLSTTSQAKVDWQNKKLLTSDNPILAMAPTFDGKKLFVLSKGKLSLYDQDGKLVGSTPVDSGMDQLTLSGFQPAGIPEKVFVASSSSGQVNEVSYSLVIPIDDTDSPFLGNANAPVTVAIFSDFQ